MNKQKGVTLIELLVVISIIALLMAILMPALQRARKQARTIICRANLSQYGLAARMYIDDSDGSFPYSFTWLYKDGGRGCRWHDASKNLNQNPELGGVLWPYLKDKDIHLCPEFDVVARMMAKSCKLSALYFSRKFLLHKYLRKLCRKTKIFNFITNSYYSTYNGTVVTEE